MKFSAEGGGFATLGIYQTGIAAAAAMQLDERLSFDLPSIQKEQPLSLVLQWGYYLTASGRGPVALGPSPVKFGAKGNSHSKYVVIRHVAVNTPALSALGSLIDGWTVPSLVHSAGDIEPGTRIIAEIDGSIALNLAANYGYNFNWVREAELGGLQGAIGLKLETRLSAALGFEASGAPTPARALRTRLEAQPNSGTKLRILYNESAVFAEFTFPELLRIVCHFRTGAACCRLGN